MGVRQWAYRHYTAIETREHELGYLFFELTRRCNLACRHCGSDCAQDTTMAEMTTDTWRRIIDYVADRFPNRPFIVLTGGEPTVRCDLEKIATHLQQRHFTWGMVTNGFLLTRDKLSALQERGLSSITLSWDGDATAQTWLRRHPRSHEFTSRALEAIGTSTVPVKDAVTCVYPGNLDQLDSIADTLLHAGITSWRLFRIFPKGRAAHDPSLVLDHAQSLAIPRWIAAHRDAYRRKGLLINFSCEGYLPFDLDRQVRTEPFFCRSGITIAAILSDGTITGCNNNGPDYYQGNIATDDFQALWETGFREMRDRTWLKTGQCTDCHAWKNCQGSSIHLRRKGMAGPDFCYVQSD